MKYYVEPDPLTNPPVEGGEVDLSVEEVLERVIERLRVAERQIEILQEREG